MALIVGYGYVMFTKLKRIFTSKEQLATDFLMKAKFTTGTNIYQISDAPVNHQLLLQKLQELSKLKQIDVIVIAKTGSFLPNPKEKLEKIFYAVKQNPINLNKVALKWNLKTAETIYVLQEYVKNKSKESVTFDENSMFSISYLKDRWKETFNQFEIGNLDLIVFYDEVAKSFPHQKILKELGEEWLKESTSPIVRMKNGRIVAHELVKELVTDKIERLWESGINEMYFQEIAEEYGINSTEVSKLLLELINNESLTDVTLYPQEELIKRRSAQKAFS